MQSYILAGLVLGSIYAISALGLVLWAALFRQLMHAPAEIRFLATVGLWVALPAAVRIVFPFS